MAFQKSDLFFVCMLRPLSNQIVIDDIEVQAAKVTQFDLKIISFVDNSQND